ncbi:hypothetical protein [Moorena sp. SIO4A5]|nr:hypothetical protein [Moorena sp. SIO4A5]
MAIIGQLPVDSATEGGADLNGESGCLIESETGEIQTLRLTP